MPTTAAPPNTAPPETAVVPAAMLVADGLGCWRGGRRLFAGLQLRLEAGQSLWLRGPNGCGKTSLLRLLSGLVRADEGGIHFDREPVHRLPERQRARLRLLAHANALKDTLTVDEALGFLCRLAGDDIAPPRLAAALRRFGMADAGRRTVRTLSQGQRRRVALARLLLAPPGTTWLLDEPYDALDHQGVATLDAVLAEQLAGGASVVLTSHLPVNVPGLRSFDLDRLGMPA